MKLPTMSSFLGFGIGLVVLLVSGDVAAQDAPQDQGTVQRHCREQGGTYMPPDAAGGFGCVYRDGSILYCWPDQCIYVPARRAGVDSAVWGGLSTAAMLGRRISNLEKKVDTIISGMNLPAPKSEADLIPLPLADSADETSFCRHGSDGTKLLVLVHNAGSGPASASMTRVEFQTSGTTKVVEERTSILSRATPSTVVEFARPANCTSAQASGSCDFQVVVDAQGAVSESNEKNNTVTGRCPRRP